MPESPVKLSYLDMYCRHYAWQAQSFQEEASTFIHKKNLACYTHLQVAVKP